MGRILDRGQWAIVDRSGGLARAFYVEDDEDEAIAAFFAGGPALGTAAAGGVLRFLPTQVGRTEATMQMKRIT